MNSLLSVQTVKSLLMALILSALIGSTAIMADDFYQASTMTNNTDWTKSSYWKSLRTGSNGSPAPGNNYYSAGLIIRTPTKDAAFNGDKLYAGYSATYDEETGVVTATISETRTILGLKTLNTTIADLYLGNADLNNSIGNSTVSINGKITVEGDLAVIDTLDSNRKINVNSILAGTGTLTMKTKNAAEGVIYLNNTANTYSGKIQVGTTGSILTVNLKAGSFNTVSEFNVLSGCSVNIVDVASDLPVNTVFSGAGAINISGTAGTVTLNTDNSDYSGVLTVNTVPLVVTKAAALGTGSVTNKSQLQFNLATDGSYGQVISGTGAVTKSGTGTLTLSGANTFTGGMTISEGKVSVATGSTSLGDGALTLETGATLIITGGDSNETLAITGAATLKGTLDLSKYLTTWETTKDYTLMTAYSIGSTEGLTLSGVNAGWGWVRSENSVLLKYEGWKWTGTTGSFMDGANWVNKAVPETTSNVTITKEDGVAQIDSDAVVNAVTLGNASNLEFEAGKTLTAQSMIMGGTDALNLTGGNLTLTNTPAFDITNSNIANKSTLTLSTGTYAKVLSGNTNLTKTGDGELTLSVANTYTGATTVSEGTLNLGIANAIASSSSVTNNAAITFADTAQTFKALSGSGTITGSGALTLVNDTDSSYSGTINGAASVTKTGAGTLYLTKNNTFTGGMTISEGKVSVPTIFTGLGDGALTLETGATLMIFGGSIKETLTISGAATLNGTLDLSEYLTTAWDTSKDYTLMTAGSIVNTTGLTLSGVGTGWGWEQSENNILLKYTAGTLGWNWTAETGSFMTAANWENTKVPEATSDVTITKADGKAQIDADVEVKSVTLDNASNLQFTAGKTLTAQTMTMGGTDALNLTGGNLTLTNAPAFNINNSDTTNKSTLTLSTGTYAKVLSGNTNLTKTGTGTLTLSGVNTYTGATTVSGGTLALTVDNAIASSASVENNAAITFGTTSQTFKALTGTGTITGSGALTLLNDTGVNTSYSGTITGDASVTKTGTGTLTLSGANTYTGTTTINAGKLVLTGDANLETSEGIIIAAGAEMDLSGMTGSQEYKVISSAGTIKGNDNTILDINVAASQVRTLTGSVSGIASINKTGNGTLKMNLGQSTVPLTVGEIASTAGRLNMQGYYDANISIQGGTFSPGMDLVGKINQLGKFVLGDNATLELDLVGKNGSSFTFDQLEVVGDVEFSTDSEITFLWNNILPNANGTFNLITATGDITYSDNFNWNNILTNAGMDINLWSVEGSPHALALIYSGGGGGESVPEPSTWALLILGALGMMYFRRKK